MPTTIIEDNGKLQLEFEFSDDWITYKYDEPITENFYNKIRYKGFKAVDIIAKSIKYILFMEIKYIIADDCNSRMSFSPNENNELINKIKESINLGDRNKVTVISSKPYIVDEVTKKTKDTLLGLLASHLQSDERLAVFNQSLFCDKTPILLLFFLERSDKLNEPESFKLMASNLKKSIEQKLSFLENIQILVVNSMTMPSELGIKVFKHSK